MNFSNSYHTKQQQAILGYMENNKSEYVANQKHSWGITLWVFSFSNLLSREEVENQYIL